MGESKAGEEGCLACGGCAGRGVPGSNVPLLFNGPSLKHLEPTMGEINKLIGRLLSVSATGRAARHSFILTHQTQAGTIGPRLVTALTIPA
jgi:hypothetical protein